MLYLIMGKFKRNGDNGKRRSGRPSIYDDEMHPTLAYDLCRASGIFLEDLAVLMKIPYGTLTTWWCKHPKFKEAINRAYPDFEKKYKIKPYDLLKNPITTEDLTDLLMEKFYNKAQKKGNAIVTEVSRYASMDETLANQIDRTYTHTTQYDFLCDHMEPY